MVPILIATLLALPQAQGDTATSLVEPTAQRVWVGPGFWGNRLQDWRLNQGRFECVEQAARFPLRTLMVLDHEVDAVAGDALQLEMLIDTIDAAQDGQPPRGFGGFIFGAGGSHVDYRISAQVHHRPAADGGVLATVNTQGEVSFHDNFTRLGNGGSWSIGGALKADELQPMTFRLEELNQRPAGTLEPMRLRLAVAKTVMGYEVRVTSYQTREGQADLPLTRGTLSSLPPTLIDGLVGMVSHLGPTDGTAGFWFDDLTMSGDMLREHPERRYGPVLGVQYTVSHQVLKLTAQLPPLSSGPDSAHGRLQVLLKDGTWRTLDAVEVTEDSWTLPFRVDSWDHRHQVDYRVAFDWVDHSGQSRTSTYAGIIPPEPEPDQEMVVASLNCAKHYVGNLQWNHDSIWFPHAEVAERVALHEPDLLYFAGDQLYEGDIDPVDARTTDKLILDYLYKWYRWQWSFGELTRRMPTVTIPDDHDVYHGNLWGAGGRKAKADKERGITQQDSGGYRYAASFVNVVHATQTSHLPDPYDPTPVEQGISVYFTELDYGGISFAIISDRQFKDSASVVVPAGKVKNGWFQAPGFDPREADVKGAVLLGERQQRFLVEWSQEWDNRAWMKVLLSQTPFVNVATIPEEASGGGVLPSLPIPEAGSYPEGFKFAADTDSGGWPQTPRDRVVRTLSDCFAIHLTGDQHLGSLVEYGADDFRDGGYAFTSPAIANTWPRRWWPPMHGADPEPGAAHYTGDFNDGFGNMMTVWAVSNPVISGEQPAALYDRTPGYGVIRLRPDSREITFECWPRWVDPLADDARQFNGWPRTISQFQNGGEIVGWLPTCEIDFNNGVAEVSRIEESGLKSSFRIPVSGPRFRIPVFEEGEYEIQVTSSADPGKTQSFTGLRPQLNDG